MKPATAHHSQTDGPTWRRVLRRFGHLVSAQGVEGITNAVFFLTLAWLNVDTFGMVMYAMAAGALVMKAVQFGLYVPLVTDWGRTDEHRIPNLLFRANLIKLVLLAPTLAAVGAAVTYLGLPHEMAWVVMVVSLGSAAEAFSETFFADFRMRGRQDQEAKIKMIASVLSYSYGFLTALSGFGPVAISFFKVVSGVMRLTLCAVVFLRRYVVRFPSLPTWAETWPLFKAASVLAVIDALGILYNKTNIFFLEKTAGVKGVAYYSATWNIVDTLSVTVSQNLLAWVLFPVLASIWLEKQKAAGQLVRSSALWLTVTAFPIMFALHRGADLIIGVAYPDEYSDAIWMQKLLVWTIFLSFQSNLFCHVMMVAGAIKTLLYFYVGAALVNLGLNLSLVPSRGMLGACWVIIFTKLLMTILAFSYCQIRFRWFRWSDLLFPVGLVATSLWVWQAGLVVSEPLSIAAAASLYGLGVWKLGPKIINSAPLGPCGISREEWLMPWHNIDVDVVIKNLTRFASHPRFGLAMAGLALEKSFLNRIPPRHGKARKIRQASFRITDVCNLRCHTCGQWGDRGFLRGRSLPDLRKKLVPPDRYMSLLADVVASGHRPFVYFWGGEPMLYDGLVNLVEGAATLGLPVSIATNGTGAAAAAERFVRAPLGLFQVSIDGPTPEMHNQARPGVGKVDNFSEILAGLDAVNEIRRDTGKPLPLVVSLTVISRANQGHLLDIYETFRDKVDMFVFYLSWWIDEETARAHDQSFSRRFGTNPRTHWGWVGDWKPNDYELLDSQIRKIKIRSRPLSAPPVVVLPSLKGAEHLKRYYTDHSARFGFNRCVSIYQAVEINSNGDLSPCRDYHDYVVGNVKTSTITQLWNSTPYRDFRRSLDKEGLMPVCSRCCGLMGF